MKENIVLTEAVYYILLSLLTPMHGYAIMQNTAELSHNRVKLAAGTLYGALNTLLEKKWIISVNTEKNSRKKEYLITEKGKTVLSQELNRLKELTENGEKLLKGELL